jgi:hypothetical protein
VRISKLGIGMVLGAALVVLTTSAASRLRGSPQLTSRSEAGGVEALNRGTLVPIAVGLSGLSLLVASYAAWRSWSNKRSVARLERTVDMLRKNAVSQLSRAEPRDSRLDSRISNLEDRLGSIQDALARIHTGTFPQPGVMLSSEVLRVPLPMPFSSTNLDTEPSSVQVPVIEEQRRIGGVLGQEDLVRVTYSSKPMVQIQWQPGSQSAEVWLNREYIFGDLTADYVRSLFDVQGGGPGAYETLIPAVVAWREGAESGALQRRGRARSLGG